MNMLASRRLGVTAICLALAVAALPAVVAQAAATALPGATVHCRGAAPGSVLAPAALPPRSGEPVLLVHGTFTNGDENYRWALAEHLATRAGLNVCWFDYPNRGLDDMQTSAEMTADAIVQVASATGQNVDVLGHSQGALLPRWAVRWFPEARAVVDDLVLLAGPHQGTRLTSMYGKVPGAGCQSFICTEAMWQFDPDSQFIGALNRSGLTDDAQDVTNIYTLFDELVRHDMGSTDPRAEVEAAAKLADDGAPGNVVNVLIQDLCPGRPVEHAGMFIDHVMARLAVDAFTRTGPADPSIIGPQDCARGPFDGFDLLVAAPIGPTEIIEQRGFDYRPVAGEPATRPYAS